MYRRRGAGVQVLHLREVYARDLFQRHRLYDVMVRKSRHPQLNEYIHAVVQSLKVKRGRRWVLREVFLSSQLSTVLPAVIACLELASNHRLLFQSFRNVCVCDVARSERLELFKNAHSWADIFQHQGDYICSNPFFDKNCRLHRACGDSEAKRRRMAQSLRVCNALQDPLIRGVVKQVAVLILNAHGLVVEKFIADLQVREWEVFSSLVQAFTPSFPRKCYDYNIFFKKGIYRRTKDHLQRFDGQQGQSLAQDTSVTAVVLIQVPCFWDRCRRRFYLLFRLRISRVPYETAS